MKINVKVCHHQLCFEININKFETAFRNVSKIIARLVTDAYYKIKHEYMKSNHALLTIRYNRKKTQSFGTKSKSHYRLRDVMDAFIILLSLLLLLLLLLDYCAKALRLIQKVQRSMMNRKCYIIMLV